MGTSGLRQVLSRLGISWTSSNSIHALNLANTRNRHASRKAKTSSKWRRKHLQSQQLKDREENELEEGTTYLAVRADHSLFRFSDKELVLVSRATGIATESCHCQADSIWSAFGFSAGSVEPGWLSGRQCRVNARYSGRCGKPLNSLRVCGCEEPLIPSSLVVEGRRLYGRQSVCSFGRPYIATDCAIFNHCYGTCTVSLWRAVPHLAPLQIVIDRNRHCHRRHRYKSLSS
ncbi:hypothetical protein PoB_007274100 [Plakobranchus ocellatus]|uniref:Uncharacterized protein n=1 Tax=Plakobranchus ocellatus TaxID=259542 RepID=A0AAV4DQ38_9GAST|nr:hypothetical protein PoB_007274100 [Plakobranchus ocellatus]